MVNTVRNLSAHNGTPPQDDQANRLISSSPLYKRDAVLKILDSFGEDGVRPWTRKCIGDLQKYEIDHEDLVQLIREALDHGRFLRAEWCVQKPSGPWAACDSYCLARSEWSDVAHKYLSVEYYVKYAVGKTGKLLLVVSCHLSEDRG